MSTIVAGASLECLQGSAVDWETLWLREVASLLDLDHENAPMVSMQYPSEHPLTHINLLQTVYA